MASPGVVPVVDEGLGNSSYFLDLGDRRALVIDPPRDLRAIRSQLARDGLRVGFAADTHLHADFLSGARQLAAADGARVLASASANRKFPHAGLRDGDEIDLGGLRLRAMATPGHTTEHLSFLLMDGGSPVGVFTGGSLLVGSAARTDLVDAERTEDLARAQYASLRRLLALPDEVAVWPTHGAGSFCSAPMGPERTSTIGRERATNPLLAAEDEEEFVRRLLAGLGSYPPYFDRLAEVNRRGPAVIAGAATLVPLDVAAVRGLITGRAQVVDVRPVADYAAAHLPGALSIPLRPAFATWLGWLADPTVPIIIVRNPDQDPEEITWQALKIGYENLAGELAGGMDAWSAGAQPVRRTMLLGPGDIAGRLMVDVRQEGEYAAGHLPGAAHLELGEIAALGGTLPRGPVAVMCGHGQRAASAASLLERAGRSDVAVLVGGPEDWAQRTGGRLETAE
jgi:glyoxylase-like metal-dependent hydrolase (beta-lactamase superfamily II)/rhodanese-related sulfurtransferase